MRIVSCDVLYRGQLVMTATCTADAAPIICQSGLGEASMI